MLSRCCSRSFEISSFYYREVLFLCGDWSRRFRQALHSDRSIWFRGGWRSGSECGNDRINVRDAVAENLAGRERFDSLDLGRDQKSRLPRREWRVKFNQGIERVLFEAVEADAALREVFALDDFLRLRRVAHRGAESHANSNVAPLVDRPSVCIKLSRGGVPRYRTRHLSGSFISVQRSSEWLA
jgi:hypothetical protein